jgi:hypothetical protein
MSSGLLSQLDTYYAWIDERQNPIDPDEVAALIDSPVRGLAIPVTTDRRHPWLIGVAAAAVVLVVLGGVAFLTRVAGSETRTVAAPPNISANNSAPKYSPLAIKILAARTRTDR